jgi:flagellar basal-body rod modification protein FlgD
MIQGISANDPFLGGGAAAKQELGRDAFMQLLVNQLKNQDPLSPTSHEEFIAQLAQFSSLDEMRGVNENLVALALLQQNNALMAQLTDASALIGKNVVYLEPESGEEVAGSVESVKLKDGLAVLRIDGKDVPLTNVVEVKASEDSGDGDAD